MTATVRRIMVGESVFISVEDMIHVIDKSRDRFKLEGNLHASEAMERLTFVLSMLTLIESV